MSNQDRRPLPAPTVPSVNCFHSVHWCKSVFRSQGCSRIRPLGHPFNRGSLDSAAQTSGNALGHPGQVRWVSRWPCCLDCSLCEPRNPQTAQGGEDAVSAGRGTSAAPSSRRRGKSRVARVYSTAARPGRTAPWGGEVQAGRAGRVESHRGSH